jgi:hypothetical protein
MNKKLITYTLLFSFLLTVSGCYTSNYYADSPEELISKEKGQKNVIYENLDSMTLVNNKTVKLSQYTSKFIKSYMDSSYKFVYYNKKSVADTLDIRNITFINYSAPQFQLGRTITVAVVSVIIAAFTGMAFALASIGGGSKH